MNQDIPYGKNQFTGDQQLLGSITVKPGNRLGNMMASSSTASIFNQDNAADQ